MRVGVFEPKLSLGPWQSSFPSGTRYMYAFYGSVVNIEQVFVYEGI